MPLSLLLLSLLLFLLYFDWPIKKQNVLLSKFLELYLYVLKYKPIYGEINDMWQYVGGYRLRPFTYMS